MAAPLLTRAKPSLPLASSSSTSTSSSTSKPTTITPIKPLDTINSQQSIPTKKFQAHRSKVRSLACE